MLPQLLQQVEINLTDVVSSCLTSCFLAFAELEVSLNMCSNAIPDLQIQAELGEGHVNIIEAKEVLVTHTHLALSLEYAAGGSLTSYVADRWQHSQHAGLFLSEDEARYFFRVKHSMYFLLCSSSSSISGLICKHACIHAHWPHSKQIGSAVQHCNHLSLLPANSLPLP